MNTIPHATASDTVQALMVYAINGGVRISDGAQPQNSPCGICKHARQTMASHHLLCSKPCVSNTFNNHGVKMGWAMYPVDFDPVWRTSECPNFHP